MAEKQYDKYLIIKWTTIEKYLSINEAEQFDILLDCARLRQQSAENKLRNNKYIICNQDEPYAEDVWQAILAGEAAKEQQIMKTTDIIPVDEKQFANDSRYLKSRSTITKAEPEGCEAKVKQLRAENTMLREALTEIATASSLSGNVASLCTVAKFARQALARASTITENSHA